MKPLKFEPLLKSTIWGGNKIIAFKHLDIKQEKVGESWEISGVPGNESIVADGEMKGKKLNEVVAELKENFLGADNYKRFGNEFPLLIKFIDANTDLSIQVHPNDEIAKKQGKERGKTEMWYALPSEPDAKLYNGLKMQITPEQYKEMVENDTITDALAQYNVKEDDCFFIPAGRIHTIGTAVSLSRFSRPAMLPIASTISSARTRMATIASSTPRKHLSASTTPYWQTIARTTLLPRIRVLAWYSALTSPQPFMISMNL